MMIERFVATGETEEDAERNLGSLIEAFGQFLTLYAAGGRRPIPATDGEFRVDHAARKNRPAIAVSGTPDQIAAALQQVIDETGARRLLVETFSREEARLFAREVIPALKERNATAA
jgi:alkanesulfonate monooxygenase SsuD/methylene tetrahydromethanopterin reductase-like flavin-dependent oxidoreductase (luciferase family)